MDFVILKVNGKDLSSANHSEVVKAFKSATDPIIVEVSRCHRPSDTDSEPYIVDPYTTTDLYHVCPRPLPRYSLKGDSSPLSASSGPIFQAHKGHNCAGPLNVGGIMEEKTHLEDIRSEEVTLRKEHPGQIFGLTLCYSAETAKDDCESEVYIRAIESGSIAGQQSSIQVGDQIVRINDVRVHSKCQVVSLFATSGMEVRLLLARRALATTENSFTNCRCPLNGDTLVSEEMEYYSVYDDVEDRKHCQTQLDKDSGIGRGAGDANWTGESSEYDSSQTSLRHSSQYSTEDSMQSHVDMTQVSEQMQHLALEYQHLQRLLQTRSGRCSTRTQPLPSVALPSCRVIPRMGTKSDHGPMKVPTTVPTSVVSTRSIGTCNKIQDSVTEVGPPPKVLMSLNLEHVMHGRSPGILDDEGHQNSAASVPAEEIWHIISDNEYSDYDVRGHSTMNDLSLSSQSGRNGMDWVVKKRPDGTRFITRRQRRTNVPKDRAKKQLVSPNVRTDDNHLCKLELQKNKDSLREKTSRTMDYGLTLHSTKCEMKSSNPGATRVMYDKDLLKLAARPSFVVGSTLF